MRRGVFAHSTVLVLYRSTKTCSTLISASNTMADQPTVKHPPDPGISDRHASKNLPEMAPRQTHADLHQFSEPILDDSQAGSDRSNTPYGYGGATYSTSTSRDAPMRPNLARPLQWEPSLAARQLQWEPSQLPPPRSPK